MTAAFIALGIAAAALAAAIAALTRPDAAPDARLAALETKVAELEKRLPAPETGQGEAGPARAGEKTAAEAQAEAYMRGLANILAFAPGGKERT